MAQGRVQGNGRRKVDYYEIINMAGKVEFRVPASTSKGDEESNVEREVLSPEREGRSKGESLSSCDRDEDFQSAFPALKTEEADLGTLKEEVELEIGDDEDGIFQFRSPTYISREKENVEKVEDWKRFLDEDCEDKSPYSCGICNNTFKLKTSLRKHIDEHLQGLGRQSRSRFYCNFCDKAYRNISFCKKPFNCSICGRVCSSKPQTLANSGGNVLKNKNSFNPHTLNHLGDKQFICDLCGKCFNRNCNLVGHRRIHFDEQLFKCDVCKQGFTHKYKLKRHQLNHSGNKPFKCNVCSKSFIYKSHLERHTLIHSDNKSFKCDVCGKRFTWKGHLTRHSLTHLGERPFECNVCGKTFTLKSHLKRHILTHLGKRPFQCRVCKKAFTRRSNLKRHYLIHSKR